MTKVVIPSATATVATEVVTVTATEVTLVVIVTAIAFGAMAATTGKAAVRFLMLITGGTRRRRNDPKAEHKPWISMIRSPSICTKYLVKTW